MIREPLMQTAAGRVSPALEEFLRSGSRSSLLALRLARQTEAANLRRELGAVLDQLMEAELSIELLSLFLDPPGVRGALPPSTGRSNSRAAAARVRRMRRGLAGALPAPA